MGSIYPKLLLLGYYGRGKPKGIPSNAILDRNGVPIVDRNGQYIVTRE